MRPHSLPAQVRPTTILDASGRPMGYIGAPAHQAADLTSQELINFRPSLLSADAAWLPERSRVIPRIHDLARNDGWTAGTLNRYVDEAIGASFRMTYMPDHVALGIDTDAALELALEVEAAFRQFANDPRNFIDAQQKLNFSAQVGLAFRHRMRDGECFAALRWQRRPWFAYRTAVLLISPERVSNPNDAPDSDTLRGGVEMDASGVPIAYHVRTTHPGDAFYGQTDRYKWEKIDRRTPWGRPIMVHHFEPEDAGQTRGKSSLAAVVKKVFMANKYADAEMQAALINAVLAAYIESPMSSEDVAEALTDNTGDFDAYMASRTTFHETSKLTLNGARIPVLYPGEKIGMVDAARPNASYADFEKRALRYYAAATGQSYEQAAADFSETNYSSARAALLGPWKFLNARRDAFGQQFCSPIAAAWLEEAIDIGRVKLPKGAPDFWEAYAAYTQFRWTGPGRGWVDPTKEAEAAGIRMEYGLSCLQDEAADQGQDYYDLMIRQARERKLRKRFGLPDPRPASVANESDTESANRADNEEDAARTGNSRERARRARPKRAA
ncbi:MAG: phage portal protein [Rhodospirillaceae bacterium]|nr:phage portal protein [Rhodospirillaceae bacterium]